MNDQTVKDLPHVETIIEGYGLGTSVGRPALCAVNLVEGPDAKGKTTRILVDTGHVGRRQVLWAALASRGIAPADIDMVFLTHAHWDHVQNVDVFGSVPLLLHPDELEYSLDPHPREFAMPSWTHSLLERQTLRHVVEGDELIPGVKVVELPGHTVGSIGLAVDTPDGCTVVAGDALHYARVALEGRNPLVFWDTELAAQSIERIVAMADVIYPGHDRPFRIEDGTRIAYQRPFDLTLSGVSPDEPGLRFDSSHATWSLPADEDLASRKRAMHAVTEARLRARAQADSAD